MLQKGTGGLEAKLDVILHFNWIVLSVIWKLDQRKKVGSGRPVRGHCDSQVKGGNGMPQDSDNVVRSDKRLER